MTVTGQVEKTEANGLVYLRADDGIQHLVWIPAIPNGSRFVFLVPLVGSKVTVTCELDDEDDWVIGEISTEGAN